MATGAWQQHVWVGFSLVAAAGLVWLPELRRSRARRWWFVYVAGIFLYSLLRSYADDLGFPVRTGYVIQVERLLFFGRIPVVALQGALFSAARLTALDWFAAGTHWSFFVVPHAVAIAVFVWRRELFPKFTVAVVGTMYLGLVFFVVLPTSPPWLAAQLGSLPEVFRILDLVGGRIRGDSYASLYASLGAPNEVAAVPSIHMAVTFALYLFVREHHPRLALFALLYLVAMGFSLVYLAEHYTLDLVVGMAGALAAYLGAGRLMTMRRAARTTAAS